MVVRPVTDREERRAPLAPEHVKKLGSDGWKIVIPAGLGERATFTDDAYREAGAAVVDASDDRLRGPGVVLTLFPPTPEEIDGFADGSSVLGFLDPFGSGSSIRRLAERGLDAVSLELVPRTTIAQSMDALSSQANLAGYAAVLLASSRLTKALPMMSTAAGTIRPAKVLVVGTGVAGLQAIATAQRLGARVTAYDVRPVAKEQVESLGARFAKIDLGETGEAKGGYAKALTDDQLTRQREQLAKLCAESDIIITTAQIFGRRAPVIVTDDMVRGMAPGSVIVDAAAATGGNVQGGVAGEERVIDGVTVIADAHLPSRVASDATRVLGANIVNLVTHAFDPRTGRVRGGDRDEITSGVLLTSGGEILDERVRTAVNEGSV
ncbi:MAG: NAD(P)(+) transhydrogenase (Re/Si-specific) subunit alpha [Phycisphaerae bacterium]|nr:NAD(P)(+) transhydrogenase (Re/Si-specific) subunit alpha [Phycisphaerae bacterium]